MNSTREQAAPGFNRPAIGKNNHLNPWSCFVCSLQVRTWLQVARARNRSTTCVDAADLPLRIVGDQERSYMRTAHVVRRNLSGDHRDWCLSMQIGKRNSRLHFAPQHQIITWTLHLISPSWTSPGSSRLKSVMTQLKVCNQIVKMHSSLVFPIMRLPTDLMERPIWLSTRACWLDIKQGDRFHWLTYNSIQNFSAFTNSATTSPSA